MVMPNKQKRIEAHCRDVIKACLNVVEEKGDTYVAIHKDDEAECVVLVSMIRTHPILSVIIADKILFDNKNAAAMYRAANELNTESVTGWHTIVLTDDSSIYMYRQCPWMNADLTRDHLMDILCDCIAEYKVGRAHISASDPA